MPSQAELLAYAIATMLSGGLSLAGAAAMVTCILWNKPFLKNSRADEKILFLMAVVSLIGSFAMVQNRQVKGNQPLCQLQASLIEFSVLSLPILNVALGFNFWYILSEGKSPEQLVRYYAAVALMVPLAVTLYALFINVYGDAGIWCWIISSRTDLRFYLFFIPLWFTIFVGIVFTSLGVLKVFRIEKLNMIMSYKHTRTASKAFLYGFVFVIVWIPGTTNRIVELIMQKPSPFILVLLHTLFTPLQGFLNAVVFFYLRQTKRGSKSTEDATTTKNSGETSEVVEKVVPPQFAYDQTPANQLSYFSENRDGEYLDEQHSEDSKYLDSVA